MPEEVLQALSTWSRAYLFYHKVKEEGELKDKLRTRLANAEGELFNLCNRIGLLQDA